MQVLKCMDHNAAFCIQKDPSNASNNTGLALALAVLGFPGFSDLRGLQRTEVSAQLSARVARGCTEAVARDGEEAGGLRSRGRASAVWRWLRVASADPGSARPALPACGPGGARVLGARFRPGSQQARRAASEAACVGGGRSTDCAWGHPGRIHRGVVLPHPGGVVGKGPGAICLVPWRA